MCSVRDVCHSEDADVNGAFSCVTNRVEGISPMDLRESVDVHVIATASSDPRLSFILGCTQVDLSDCQNTGKHTFSSVVSPCSFCFQPGWFCLRSSELSAQWLPGLH